MRRIAIATLLATCPALVLAQEAFDFRNDQRPAYEESVTIGELTESRTEENVTVLDVRLIEDYEADPQLIPGALYKDPENIATWASALPEDEKIVVYCVRGKWVSDKAADYLSREGYDVAVLEGGLEAWKDAQQ